MGISYQDHYFHIQHHYGYIIAWDDHKPYTILLMIYIIYIYIYDLYTMAKIHDLVGVYIYIPTKSS